jgi:hypothetical protein
MKYAVLLTMFLFLPDIVSAQSVPDTISMEQYAVPESPAFILLNSKPDNITTPSSVKKLALEISDINNFGRSNQLLIGTRVELADSVSGIYPKIAAGTRFYYGSNEFRAYTQAECEYINSAGALTASIGGLIKVYNGIWLKPALHVVCDFTNGARFVPTLNLFYGLGYKEKITFEKTK